MKNINYIVFAGFLIRCLISFWNGLFGPSFGAESDAVMFHELAITHSQELILNEFIIGLIYSYFLGVLYFIFSDTLLFGSILSAFIWVLSAQVLVKLMRLTHISLKDQYKIMFFYILLPSSIIYTSVTLREVYQLFFINCAFYAALKIYMHRANFHWITLVFSVIGMGSLHGGLAIFGLYIIVAVIFLLLVKRETKKTIIKLTFSMPVVIVLLVYSLSLLTSISYNFEDGIGSSVEKYQQGGLLIDARAHYKSNIEINGLFDLLIFIPVSLFQYLFEPMPWRISTISDLVIQFENLFRGWLLWKIGMHFRTFNSLIDKKISIFLSISYIVIEIIWSLGTINWGTAVRHHLPSYGLLLVAAFIGANRVKK